MRSNALKKEEYFEEVTTKAAAPKVVVSAKSWETRRLEIARASEAACNLPGNLNVPDFEEFLCASDFA